VFTTGVESTRDDQAKLGGVAEELATTDQRAHQLNRRAAAPIAEHLDRHVVAACLAAGEPIALVALIVVWPGGDR
jgi:hypothetical protein